ncbi:hypothetical protein Vadar_034473 [Vaccinium darrowii]|uniref:Uncharacterized protein n=1 Tax=Vaccinium darrowii TaxID=229202 RepID=A0ACB7Z8M5_9ERIC|nr:hypothetical protein Vadar_034473 [Vaccinium darrowii]
MKIQCNVCEVAEANVLCCADEAALCWGCDEKVHAANKLASKHQRVPLSSSSSPMPKCDICQEAVGYFFCLEDRALLCRKCDLAIHTANTFVNGTPVSLDGQYTKVLPVQVGGVGDFEPTKLPSSGESAGGSFPPWQLDEYLGLTGFNQTYGYLDSDSCKADSGKFGDSDCSSILRAGEEELGADECLGQVPDASWTVPQVPSPPTASGLYWPKSYRNMSDGSIFVPDICSLGQSPAHYQPRGTSSKRRREL